MSYKIAILGDCVTHSIASKYSHTRACGLLSWASLASKYAIELPLSYDKEASNWRMPNYDKRVLLLDAKKKALDYVLEEKADYFILDCNDIRKSIFMASDITEKVEKWRCITDNTYMQDFDKYMEITSINPGGGIRGGGDSFAAT